MKYFVLSLILVLFLIIGCVQTSETATPNSPSVSDSPKTTTKPAELKTAVCGNGVLESGETSDICCQDAGCPNTFKCNSTSVNGSAVHFCQKVEKQSTFESGKIKQLVDDISTEINKEESGLRDFQKVKTKLSEIDSNIKKLVQLGYDTKTEEFLYKVSKSRSELTEIRTQRFANLSTLTEVDQMKPLVLTDLSEVTSLVATLEGFKSNYSANLAEAEQIYGYNIDLNLDTWKNYQRIDQNWLDRANRGITAELSVTSTQTRKCTSSSYSTGLISGINLDVRNTGGFDISDPRVDILVYSGPQLVEKSTENIYDSLVSGQTAHLELSPYIYDLDCETYSVKLDLRDGANPKVIATTQFAVDLSR